MERKCVRRGCAAVVALAALAPIALAPARLGRERAAAAAAEPGPAAAKPEPAAERKPPNDPFDPNCLSPGCHENLKQAKHVHGPIAVVACDTCHTPNPPNHKFKLARAEPELCTFCHKNVDDKEHLHTPVADGDCTTCHRPHGGATKSLLTAPSTKELCAQCHAPPKEAFVHGPVAVGECMACHQAHQADNAHLLNETGAKGCTGCHSDTARDIAAKKHPHEPATKDCGGCHAPHAAGTKALLRKPLGELCLACHKDVRAQVAGATVIHGAVKELDQCANCHTPHASEIAFQLRAPAIKLCFHCHDKEIVVSPEKKIKNIAAVVTGSKFSHGPIREGDCVPCHNTHGGTNYRLLKETFPEEFYQGFDVHNYALCFTCHQKTLVLDEETTTLTGFRDGSKNLHFVHVNKEVKGRTCRACHEIHASDLPKHIRESVPFGRGGWLLPINFTKTETGGTCSPGCHKALGYDRTKGGAPP